MRAALVAGLLYFVRPSSQHFWLSWTEPVLASQHLWLNWTELPLAQAVQPVDSRSSEACPADVSTRDAKTVNHCPDPPQAHSCTTSKPLTIHMRR
eukprot:s8891_g2.t1